MLMLLLMHDTKRQFQLTTGIAYVCSLPEHRITAGALIERIITRKDVRVYSALDIVTVSNSFQDADTPYAL